ncbi:hypothetical protein [Motilimonas eburnea]|uniref:hypothetical protein n=1 Tax=Motilimonas eburnea TaxID=1737488 RepID=UPI001E52B1D4|nr:hypothetical protein [Motilimonas eburnea]MCE2571657.1 hypothetical protein [Motilimonas eburnea]
MLKSRTGQQIELRREVAIVPELHHIVSNLELYELAEILHTFLPDEIDTHAIEQEKQNKCREGCIVMYSNGLEFVFEAIDRGWLLDGESTPSTEIMSVSALLDCDIELEMINKLNEDNPHYQFIKIKNSLCIRQVHDFRYGGMRVLHLISNLQSLMNVAGLLGTKCDETG